MSAYIKFATPMVDRDCLVEALTDMGIQRGQIEVHIEAVPLVGFGGVGRGQKAEVVIRRQHVGQSSNDIGFLLTPTGYSVLISDLDRQRFGAEWLGNLHGKYQIRERQKIARLEEDARQAAAEATRIAAERERMRMEEERRRLVETQRRAVMEKAKKLGYQVQEKREGDVLRIVLVKNIF
ncbi:MAG: hypothetical protein WC712_03285 [Candidatus Brocadiia bacterium]